MTNLLNRTIVRMTGSLLLLTVCSLSLYAQPDTEVFVEEIVEEPAPQAAPALDDITERQIVRDRPVLAYPPVREADILWEKRIWRVIDTREKMNLSFTSPNSPLFPILQEAVTKGDLIAYSTESDKFTVPMTKEDINNVLNDTDTIVVIDPLTYEETVQVVYNSVNWEDVKRYRIKETWWFDTNTGTLRNRILGIAPMIDVRDDQGNFRFERPLFWVYYPAARGILGSHKAFLSGDNVSANTSWEDVFEMRHFASYIIKESNTQDRRLEDYLTGTDLLLAGQQIKDELFNREHDLWQQ